MKKGTKKKQRKKKKKKKKNEEEEERRRTKKKNEDAPDADADFISNYLYNEKKNPPEKKTKGGAHHENETVVETEGSKEVPAAPVLKYPDNVLPGMPTIKPRGQMPFEPHGGHA